MFDSVCSAPPSFTHDMPDEDVLRICLKVN